MKTRQSLKDANASKMLGKKSVPKGVLHQVTQFRELSNYVTTIHTTVISLLLAVELMMVLTIWR